MLLDLTPAAPKMGGMDESLIRHCLALLLEAESLLAAEGDAVQAARLSLVIESFKDVYGAAGAESVPVRKVMH